MNHSTRYSPRRGPGDFMISNRRPECPRSPEPRGAVEGEGRDVLLPRATRRRRNAQTSHGGDTVWARSLKVRLGLLVRWYYASH